jgi:hypothetical protein
MVLTTGGAINMVSTQIQTNYQHVLQALEFQHEKHM